MDHHHVRRMEYEGELWINVNDLFDACAKFRDAQWADNFCADAMSMQAICHMLESLRAVV